MKKWFLHILLLAGLFGVLTTSCSQDEELESWTQASEEKVQVMFTIAMGNSSGNSRAAEVNYPTADEIKAFENKIDQLHVQLQMSANNPPVDVENIAFWPVEGSTNEYKFVGEVKDVEPGTSLNGVKVFVYANTSRNADGNIIKTFAPTYSESNTGKGVESIPMWGVLTITSENLSLTPGTCVNLPDINLLRAMAKVEVNLSQALSSAGYSITGVEMQKVNELGNLEPNTAANNSGKNTADYHIEACINAAAPGNISAAKPIPFIQTGVNSYIIYVPEFKVDTTNDFLTDDELKIKVFVSKNGTNINESLSVNKGYFSISSLFGNLVRNYQYVCNVTTINDGVSATLAVSVKDWNTDEEIWNYEQHVSVEQAGKMQWSGSVTTVDNTNKKVYVPKATKDAPAICRFSLGTPVGATWYASFENQTGTYDAFKFLDANGDAVTSVSGNVGDKNGAELRIITTNTEASVTSTATLRIAVRTSDGRTIIVKELVPGNNNAEYTLVQSMQ